MPARGATTKSYDGMENKSNGFPGISDTTYRTERPYPQRGPRENGVAAGAAAAAAAASRGHLSSVTSRSGNRHAGSRVIFSILRAPKSSAALNVRLPPNHTSTGYVTMAVTLSVITAFGMARSFAPVGANCTLSTTGDGICPSCLTVTVVFPLALSTPEIDPSTDSVVNSQ